MADPSRYGQMELAPVRAAHRLGRRPMILSYGGGKDSFCMLLLALDCGVHPDAMVFMDVGNPHAHPVSVPPEDSEPAEWPETYDHILNVAAPLAQKHGIPFHWIIADQPQGKLKRRMAKAGIIPEIYAIRPGTTGKGKLKTPAMGLFDFFLRMGMIPSTNKQICTQVAKIDRFNAWLADNYPGDDVDVWIGFNVDEIARKERGKTFKLEEVGGGARREVKTPLHDAGLSKTDCVEIMKRKRLPVPPKSSCVFCPFGKAWEWLDFFGKYPGLFYKVNDLWVRRRRLTAAGYRMTPVFSKYELSPPMYRLLLRLDRDPVRRDDVAGGERTTFDSMRKKKWLNAKGELTEHGEAILRVARRKPPKPGDGAPAAWRKAIVQQAAGPRPRVGIHYMAVGLEGYVEGLVTREELRAEAAGESLGTCFSEDPSKAAFVAASSLRRSAEERAELRRGRRKPRPKDPCKRAFNPDSGRTAHAPSSPDLVTVLQHIDSFGRPQQDKYLLVAGTKDPDEVYGYMDIAVFQGRAHVDWIEVVAAHRRQGVARLLYLRLYEWAGEESLAVVHGATTDDGGATLRGLRLV